MNQPLAHPLAVEQVIAPEPADYAARFTVREFLRMNEAGAFDGMKVELVAGKLERMNPPMTLHAQYQGEVYFRLRNCLSGGAAAIFTDVGIILNDDTLVGCDIAVAEGAPRENRMLAAAEVMLAVEISVTTRTRDMGSKRLAYAEAGVPAYWVVDPERGVTHLFGSPAAGDYAEVSTVRFGQPLPVPGAERAIVLG